jgi:hypothetical protein
MNERLKQLAMECNAWEQVYDQHKFMVDRTFDIEKLAELIVLKCAEIADKAEPYKANDLIKEHFGVEDARK